jgi:hypothetical protein
MRVSRTTIAVIAGLLSLAAILGPVHAPAFSPLASAIHPTVTDTTGW